MAGVRKTVMSVLAITLLSLWLCGCHHEKKKAMASSSNTGVPMKTAVVTLKQVVTPLKFVGSLNPISHVDVMSTVSGTINKMYFAYGTQVTQGQKLVSIRSDELLKDFNNAVTAFVKAKQDYFTNLSSYQGSLTQYRYGIISRNDMQTAETTHSSTTLSFYQARDTLNKIIKQVNIDSKQIENMTLENSRNINEMFKKKFDNILIYSTGNGVALYPISKGADDGDGKIQTGQDIKEGGLIVSIGDLSGYTASLQVNEIQVNQVKEGMPVTVTGDAFPNVVLHGVVDSVATQASPDSVGGGMSLFDVVVDVPKVPKAAKKIIRVGMSCHIELDIKGAPVLMVPLQAVTHTREGTAEVQVMLKDNKTKTVPVVTGLTTPGGEVAVLNGLTKGHRVRLHD